MSLLSPLGRRIVVLALLVAAVLGVIASSHGFEAAGYRPCRLCLEQRWVYYGSAPIAVFALLAERLRAPEILVRLALLALVGLFLWGGGVGFYQAGAEWGYWPGPADCSGATATALPLSAADMLNAARKAAVIDCTKAQLRILGLSFAGWNVVISTGLVALALWGALKARRSAA